MKRYKSVKVLLEHGYVETFSVANPRALWLEIKQEKHATLRSAATV